MSDTRGAAGSPGRGGSLRRLGDSLLALLQTRTEILSLEWAEERANLVRLLLAVLGVVACLQLAVVLGVLFLLRLAGEEHRSAVLGIATLALLLAAGGGALWLRDWLRRRPPMFGTTIDELRKDRESLRGRS